MRRDLVIGLDSSTQSTKAIAWTRTGAIVAEGRADVAMTRPEPGHVEQEVEDWWAAACAALRAVTRQVAPGRIAGLAISNQRETTAFLDERGRAVRPAILWLDERGRSEIDAVTKALGAERLHNLTGKPADITPALYRLAWMRTHAPRQLAASARILDVHGFLTQRLTGTAAASWTSADPSGVFDIAGKAWSALILDHLGLSAAQFGALHRPGEAVGPVNETAASVTGLAPGTPVFAAGGDGQCAGLGAGAARQGRIYLNLGTAMITGAWTPTPEISRFWRTMTSPTGQGYFLEGCQRAGALLVNWFIDGFAGGRDDPAVFDRLEQAAAEIAVGCEGLAMCPYLTGCMDPYWDPSARASFVGLSPGHRPAHLYRAVLEALTLESARSIRAMVAQGIQAERIVAVGGGARSVLWLRMFADATGLPVTRSASHEASSLGAAISAAVGAGWFDGFDDATAAMTAEGATLEPDPSTRAAWDAADVRQAAAYRPT
jgi:xylulokinase